MIQGRRDPGLSAVVTERRALFYAEGADAALDRPAHLRAASSLAVVPGGIAVLQDDANFIGLLDPVTGGIAAITLPAGPDGVRQFDDIRGNKKAKLDLEASVTLTVRGRALLVAFGSGSTKHRERIVLVDGWEERRPVVRMIDADSLYASMRSTPEFAPGRLNLEGAVLVGEELVLFSRGNGKARGGVVPVNASARLSVAEFVRYLDHPTGPSPRLSDVRQYDFGKLDGVPLGVTDAVAWGDGILISATAEASPDAIDDGAVTGSAIGVIDRDDVVRWAPVTESDGAAFGGKVEGVVAPGGAGRLWAVVDADDPLAPSLLCDVAFSYPASPQR